MEKVVVLMSTYNGEKYLRSQIESLINQEDVQVDILVRDDGSKDETIKILQEYKQSEAVKLNYYIGENIGPARSFLELMKRAPEAEYYAFCDQDDTWLPDKLKIAVDSIKKAFDDGNHICKDEIPVLYYGMPRFADNEGNLLKGPKGIYEKSLDFPSCLIKSNSTGCTMVFNRRLLEIIKSKSPGIITM
ncbi:MAG: glycosyltransferase, partial [Lachnospiraceae bacterium]|nr:glycosyltransferase [Lachnospiraceae bacterium]